MVRRAARVFGYEVTGPVAVVIRDGLVERVLPERDLRVAVDLPDLPELDAAGRPGLPGFVTAQTPLSSPGARSDGAVRPSRARGRGGKCCCASTIRMQAEAAWSESACVVLIPRNCANASRWCRRSR